MITKIDFIKWPDAEAKQAAFKEQMQKGLRTPNCYLMLYGSVWHVKMYLGGKQRLLGESSNGARAARFADMAILHFLPYRKHRNRPPADNDFTYGMASAQADLDTVPEAREMLVKWENALVSRGLIVRAVNDFIGGIPQTPKSLAHIRRDLHLAYSQYKECVLHARAVLKDVDEAAITLDLIDVFLGHGAKYNTSLEKLLIEHASESDPECAARRAANERAQRVASANEAFVSATVDAAGATPTPTDQSNVIKL